MLVPFILLVAWWGRPPSVSPDGHNGVLCARPRACVPSAPGRCSRSRIGCRRNPSAPHFGIITNYCTAIGIATTRYWGLNRVAGGRFQVESKYYRSSHLRRHSPLNLAVNISMESGRCESGFGAEMRDSGRTQTGDRRPQSSRRLSLGGVAGGVCTPDGRTWRPAGWAW